MDWDSIYKDKLTDEELEQEFGVDGAPLSASGQSPLTPEELAFLPSTTTLQEPKIVNPMQEPQIVAPLKEKKDFNIGLEGIEKSLDEIRKQGRDVQKPLDDLRNLEDDVQKPLTPQDRYEQLLQNLADAQKKRDEEVKKAREKARNSKLFDGLAKASATIGEGLAANPITKKINMQPSLLETPDYEKQAEEDAKSRLSNIMNQYRLIQGKDKVESSNNKKYFQMKEGIVEVNKKTGETKMVKESDLANATEKRLSQQFEHKKEKADRLSDKEVESITAFEDGQRILTEVEDLLKNKDVTSRLGEIPSRMENLKSWTPLEKNKDFVKMQQLVGMQLADYVKSISGAQVSEQEAARLLKNIPNMTDKQGEFKVKLDTFKKELDDARSNYLKNIGKQKSGAEKFLKEDNSVKQNTESESKTIAKKMYSESRNKTKIIYSDGSEEIVDGKR